jgi:ubiquinone/menaquinone biosynthesis C-methylase UbiE
MARYDAEWIASLNSPERVRVTRPAELLREAGARPGDTIVDVGCGPGFLTLPAAQLAGPTGRVVGVDTESRMREYVVHAARKAGLENVTAVPPDEAARLAAGVARVVAAGLFLHDLAAAERDAALAEMHRLCAPGGRLLTIEWVAPGGLDGPSTETRFSALDLAALLRRNGFQPHPVRQLGDRYFAIIATRE